MFIFLLVISQNRLNKNHVIYLENVLNLLTKYELLITEQYCIDTLKPNLNLDLIVNVGGLTNKGASGYIVLEEELFKRSQNLINGTFSEETLINKLNLNYYFLRLNHQLLFLYLYFR
jgi:hypothetical protein